MFQKDEESRQKEVLLKGLVNLNIQRNNHEKGRMRIKPC